MAIMLIRLEIGALRPFVPSIYEDKGLMQISVLVGLLDDKAQPPLINRWCAAVVDVGIAATSRSIVPGSHDAPVYQV